MAVILVPDFGGELVQGLAWHVAVTCFQSVDPNYELMTLPLRERQDTVLQLGYAHHG
jgi:hypothetical protein